MRKEDVNDLYYWQELYEAKLKREKKDSKTEGNYLRVILKFIAFVNKLQIKDLSEISTDTILDYLLYRDDDHKINQKNRFVKKYSLNNSKKADKKLIDDYIKNDSRDLAKNTKLNDIKALKIFLGFIEDESYIKNGVDTIDFPYLKWSRIKLKSERNQRKEYDIETIQLILKHLHKRIANGRTKFDYSLSFAFRLCLFGGLRATEACTIRLIDFGKKRKSSSGEIKIDVTVRGKGNTTLSVPVTYEYIKKELSYFSRTIKNEREMIFKTTTNKDFTRFTFYRDIEKVVNILGIKEKGLHRARHTFAKILNNKGVDISVIQVILRHTSIATTQLYTGVSTKRVDDATSIF